VQASGVIDACSQPSSNPVLNGIDLVSVFESASKGNATIPVTGSKKFSFVDQEGFEWWFENQQNLDAYSSSPDSFPLGAGGYCALAGEWGVDTQATVDLHYCISERRGTQGLLLYPFVHLIFPLHP
jgi:hypothetical protein